MTRLTILEVIRNKGKPTYAKCKCQCGTIKNYRLCHVKNESIKSCGCLRKEKSKITGDRNTQHGHAGKNRSKEYRSWESMKSRCYNQKDPSYQQYGARGISVCNSWIESFGNFLEDMGERPSGTSIDRINNELGYYKENCRWASPITQNRNKRNNRMVFYIDKNITIADLSDITNKPYGLLYDRIVRQGWTVEKSIA